MQRQRVFHFLQEMDRQANLHKGTLTLKQNTIKSHFINFVPVWIFLWSHLLCNCRPAKNMVGCQVLLQLAECFIGCYSRQVFQRIFSASFLNDQFSFHFFFIFLFGLFTVTLENFHVHGSEVHPISCSSFILTPGYTVCCTFQVGGYSHFLSEAAYLSPVCQVFISTAGCSGGQWWEERNPHPQSGKQFCYWFYHYHLLTVISKYCRQEFSSWNTGSCIIYAML